MKIWEKLAVTAITESPEIVLTKGISALVVCSDLKPHLFTAETISVWIERVGKNIDIAKEMLLKDFVALGTFGEDIIQSNATLLTIANCDLTQDAGFIVLSESETIKFKLRNLDAAKIYELHGIESFFPTSNVNQYERKSMGSEDVSRDFDLKGYDLASLQNHASITEIALTHENGSVAKFTPFELKTQALSTDSANYVDTNAIKVTESDRIVFPVHQIVNVNIRKEPGTRLDFSLRIDEEDRIRYHMPAK